MKSVVVNAKKLSAIEVVDKNTTLAVLVLHDLNIAL